MQEKDVLGKLDNQLRALQQVPLGLQDMVPVTHDKSWT